MVGSDVRDREGVGRGRARGERKSEEEKKKGMLKLFRSLKLSVACGLTDAFSHSRHEKMKTKNAPKPLKHQENT